MIVEIWNQSIRSLDSLAASRPLVEFVLELESQGSVGRVVVQTKKHRSVVLELAAWGRDDLSEKSRPDAVLGFVAEVVGPAEGSEPLQARLEARVAPPLELPFVVDR